MKNVWVRTPHSGSRKTAQINLTHFVGTVSGSDCAIKPLDGVRATLRMTFPPRFELRAPRFFFDLRVVTAKVAADYAERGHFGKAIFRFFGAQAAGPWFLAACRITDTKLVCGRLIDSASCRDEKAAGLCSPEMTVLRAPHVRACASVDFDRLAFLDEKRHVYGLAGFELCRLGHITGSVAAQTFR